MTVKTQRKSRTPSSTTVGTSRRPRTTRARHLALLVEFADAELTATATARWAKELPAIRWSSAPEVLSTGPTRRDVTRSALRALQRTLATKLDGLVPTSDEHASLLVQEVGAHRAVLQVSGRQGRANGLFRVAQRVLDRGAGDPRGRGPSACPMSQAGVSPRLREKAASAVLFTEVLANHAVAALVCGAPAGSAAPSPGGLSGAGQEGLSAREGRHTHAARATAVNKGEGVAELRWCSGQSVGAARVRRPAARTSLRGACASTEAWRIMPFKRRHVSIAA